MHCYYTKALDIARHVTTQRFMADPQGALAFTDDMAVRSVAKFVLHKSTPFIEATAFAETLAQHDALRLPFSECYFQTDFDNKTWCYFVREMQPCTWAIRTIVFADDGSSGHTPWYAVAFSLEDDVLTGYGGDPFKSRLKQNEIVSNIDDAFWNVAGFCAFLNFKQATIEHVGVDPCVNAKRALLSKPLLPEYSIVRLDMAALRTKHKEAQSCRSSPRPHWRRGHVRFVGDKYTPVSPSAVMAFMGAKPQYVVA